MMKIYLTISLLTLGLDLFGFRLMTYNLENYNESDRLTDTGYRKQYPKPEAAKTPLRAVIRATQPDILVVQEIGSPSFLEELQSDLKQEGLNFPFTLHLAGPDEQRNLAALSRLPFKAEELHAVLPFSFGGAHTLAKRGLLGFTVQFAPNTDLRVWVLHLKSRITQDPSDPDSSQFRAAEATALRERVLASQEEHALPLFVILGDFNSGTGERPVRAFCQKGTYQISHLLPATDSRGEIWTHFHRKEEVYKRIDHILVSPELFRRMEKRSAPPAATIVDKPAVHLASDHRPLYIDF